MKLKLLFIFLVFVGISFGSGVSAVIVTGDDCDAVINDALKRGEVVKNVAVFARSKDSGTDSNEDPTNIHLEACVIAESSESATFEEMRKYGVFDAADGEEEKKAEFYDPALLSIGWSDVETEGSPKAKFATYKFKKTFSYTTVSYAGATGQSTSKTNTGRLRYKVDGEYIYFMRMHEVPEAEDLSIKYRCNDLKENKDACLKTLPTQCFWLERGSGECWSRFDPIICDELTKYPKLCGTGIGSSVCKMDGSACVSKVDTSTSTLPSGFEYGPPQGYKDRGGVIPDCAFTEMGCRDVNDLLQLIVNFGKFMFGGIAVFAFIFFIYGGVTFLTSFGNADRVKQGREILVAAVLGLVVAFTAYMLIYLLLDFVGVKDVFRGGIK